MPIDPRRVHAFLGERSDMPLEIRRAPLPVLSEAGYAAPNSDGSRKACSNCVHYAIADKQCGLHRKRDVILPDDWCRAHMFTAQPRQSIEDRLRADSLTPADSRLMRMPGGVSCDRCVHYSSASLDSGICAAVDDEYGVPATVAMLASCARFTPPVS
jgi:hypothetical protein